MHERLKADYIGGDARYAIREGGVLAIEETRVAFYTGLPRHKVTPGPIHPFSTLIDVRFGGGVRRSSGVGTAFVFGLPGAAVRAATKGRRTTTLHIVSDEGSEACDCVYAVDRARAEVWVAELAETVRTSRRAGKLETPQPKMTEPKPEGFPAAARAAVGTPAPSEKPPALMSFASWPPPADDVAPPDANGSGLGGDSIVPAEVKKWNWGAFFLSWIWGIRHKVWKAFLVWIPFFGIVWVFVLGAKGSEWAWRKSHWTSVAEFRRIQRKWGVVGLIVGVVGWAFWGVLLAFSLFASPAGVDKSPAGVDNVERGGSISVNGTNLGCRVSSANPAWVECGPTDAQGHASPGKLRVRLSTRFAQVVRASGHVVFSQNQPPSPTRSSFPTGATGQQVALGKGYGVFIAGTDVLCTASSMGAATTFLQCGEVTDSSGNEYVLGHYGVQIDEASVVVFRSDGTASPIEVFRRHQPQ